MPDYKLVPAEPTEAIRKAIKRAAWHVDNPNADDVWRDALAAAPPANGRYSQGVCGYSPVVLCDGRPITIDEIVRRLNALPAESNQPDAWEGEPETPDPEPNELARLEREIAESSAITLLHCNAFKRDDGWFHLDGPVAPDHPHMKDEPDIRYLELRGLLERHPDNPNLVRIKERGDE